MDIFDKLFNREPKAEPMPDPNMKRISEMSGRLSAQDRQLLDDMVYLQESRSKIMNPKPPQGEKLAYINPMEEEILRNSGASVPTMTPEGIPSFAPDDPLKQAASLLNSAAPQGESLAYINSEEAEMLKDAGGAGEPVNSSGVPSFFLNKLFGGGKAPPKMPKLDVGKSARDYVNAMSDPAIQGKLLQTRQTYDPQYQDLQISLAQRAADPMAQLAENLSLIHI